MKECQVVKCPCCGALHQMVKPSKKLGRVEIFSDGKTVSEEMNEALEVSRCSQCSEFYWIEDAPVASASAPVSDSLPWVRLLSVDEYEQMLLATAITTDVEEILRMELLWAFNDRVRRDEPIFVKESDEELWKSNIGILAKLQDGTNAYSRLLKAELARELGNFEEAAKLLSSVKEASVLSIKQQLLDAVERKDPNVFKLRQ